VTQEGVTVVLVVVVAVVVQVVAEVVIVEVVAVKETTSVVLDEIVAVMDVAKTEVVAEVETVGTTTGCRVCQFRMKQKTSRTATDGTYRRFG